MGKAVAWFQKLTHVLALIIVAFAAVIIALDVFSLFFESVTRYIMGSSWAFMEEFPRLLVPFIVFPMLGVLYKTGRHITVDMLPEKLSPKPKTVLRIVVGLVVLGVAIELLFAGNEAVAHFKMMGLMSVTEWVVPMWLIYLTFPVGFGLLIIFVLESIVSDIWQLYLLMTKNAPSTAAQGTER
jgi:TRAP-type C4-dicarboxylate transport system permease small subunit